MRYCAFGGLMAGTRIYVCVVWSRVSAFLENITQFTYTRENPAREMFFPVTTCYVMLRQFPVTHIFIYHHHQSTNGWPEPIST